MGADIVDLREFYLSALGHGVRGLLRWHLGRLWRERKGMTLLTLGFGTPFMRPWLDDGGRTLALMAAEQGAVYWPREGKNKTALADFADLPLPDESVDRVLVVHALESTQDPDAFLREVWRVLKGNGRALLVVPNRHGFWAHQDDTPFGTGRPYSLGQMKALVNAQGFIVGKTSRALYFPPVRFRLGLALAARIERLFSLLMPNMGGGLLLVEVEKQLYAPLLARAKVRRRLVWSMPLPVSSGPVPT